MELLGSITSTALGAGTVGSPFAATVLGDEYGDFFPVNTTVGSSYVGTSISAVMCGANETDKVAVENTISYVESMSQEELIQLDALLVEKGFELEFSEPNEASLENPKVYQKL